MRLFMDNGGRWTVDGGRWTVDSLFRGLLLPLLLLFATGLFAQQGIFPEKPDPAVYVHDYSGWLSGQEKDILEQKLRAYTDSTSTQIVVMIRPDIGDYDRSSYAFELGNKWGIGRKSKNNGVVVLIKTEAPDRGVFIATGYGTEGALPDITAGRIIRNTMIPFFQKERYYEGINAGLDDIISALSGEFKADAKDRKKSRKAGLVLLLVFFTMLFLVIFIIVRAAKGGTVYTSAGPKRRNRRRNDDWWGGGGGFGGWGGGGGFGGGGFGGGSFGGGGAGGGW